MAGQAGFFDTQERLSRLSASGKLPERVRAVVTANRQFRFGSHLYAAFRSGSRIPSGHRRSRAKTCEGPFVTGTPPPVLSPLPEQFRRGRSEEAGDQLHHRGLKLWVVKQGRLAQDGGGDGAGRSMG